MRRFDRFGKSAGLCALALAVLAMAVLAAGCGGGDSSTDSGGGGGSTPSTEAEGGGGNAGVAEAEKKVAEAQQPIKFEPPGPAFEMSQNKGKTVYFIAPTLALPFVVQIVEGLEEAAKEAGVKVVVWDGKGVVSTQNAGLQQAIAQNADGIIMQAVDPKLLANSVNQAAAKGIPIIDANNTQPDDPTPAGVFGHVGVSTEREGQIQVDYATAQSEGDVTATMINAPLFAVYRERIPAVEAEFEKVCPDCSFDVKDIDITKPTQIPGVVSSVIRANPDTNWIFPALDGMVPQIELGLKSAGSTADGVQIASTDALTEQLEQIGSSDVLTADVGSYNPWQGWAELDLIGRAMAGEEPLNYEMPLRLFTKESPPETATGNWTGVDYQAEYKKLWQLGG